MDLLVELLSSRARAEILRLLFTDTHVEIHLRELERRTNLTIGSLQQEVRKLVRLDLIKSRRDGNRLYYSARTEHPIFPELKNIVEKVSGYIHLLKIAIAPLPVSVAFIFGSVARNEEKASSDIDLIVIGETSLRQLASILRTVSRLSAREINPHVYTVEAWRRKIAARDHFIQNLLKTEKRFLIGDADVLKILGK